MRRWKFAPAVLGALLAATSSVTAFQAGVNEEEQQAAPAVEAPAEAEPGTEVEMRETFGLSDWRIIALGPLPGGRTFAAANAINDHGLIAGYGTDEDDARRAVVWRPVGEEERWRIEELPAPDEAQALGVSDTGLVVGSSGGRPYLWRFDAEANQWSGEPLGERGAAHWVNEEGTIVEGVVPRDDQVAYRRWSRHEEGWQAADADPPDMSFQLYDPRPIGSGVFFLDSNSSGVTVGYREFVQEIAVPPELGKVHFLQGAQEPAPPLAVAEKVQEAIVAIPTIGLVFSGVGPGLGAPSGFQAAFSATGPTALPIGGFAGGAVVAGVGGGGIGGGGGGNGGGGNGGGGNGGGGNGGGGNGGGGNGGGGDGNGGGGNGGLPPGEVIPEPSSLVIWMTLLVVGLACLLARYWGAPRTVPPPKYGV
ncbi:MAG: hypothetical protein KY475_03940 [Planctomycetes bacterium]|nr:hypothetical protein [Planctomycetota bacterium]